MHKVFFSVLESSETIEDKNRGYVAKLRKPQFIVWLNVLRGIMGILVPFSKFFQSTTTLLNEVFNAIDELKFISDDLSPNSSCFEDTARGSEMETVLSSLRKWLHHYFYEHEYWKRDGRSSLLTLKGIAMFLNFLADGLGYPMAKVAPHIPSCRIHECALRCQELSAFVGQEVTRQNCETFLDLLKVCGPVIKAKKFNVKKSWMLPY